MTDVRGYYDQSYPPSVYSGGGGGVPDPSITSLAPNTAVAGSGPVTVTVTGTLFQSDSVVEVDQVAKATTFVSATSLTASYDPLVAGDHLFTVRNGGSGGEESNPSTFTVTVAQEPEE
jgi:hypothetical protein